MSRVRSTVFVALIAGILVVILATDLPSVRAVLDLAGPDQDSPQALLDHALQQASDAGSFEVAISLDQTLRQEHPLRFHAPEETLRILGSAINIGQEARIKLRAVLTKYNAARLRNEARQPAS